MTRSEDFRTRVAKAAQEAIEKNGYPNRPCVCELAVPIIRTLQFPEMTLREDGPPPLRLYVFVHCATCGAGIFYDAVKLIGSEQLRKATGGFDDVSEMLN